MPLVYIEKKDLKDIFNEYSPLDNTILIDMLLSSRNQPIDTLQQLKKIIEEKVLNITPQDKKGAIKRLNNILSPNPTNKVLRFFKNNFTIFTTHGDAPQPDHQPPSRKKPR
jgi:hypothetical protein